MCLAFVVDEGAHPELQFRPTQGMDPGSSVLFGRAIVRCAVRFEPELVRASLFLEDSMSSAGFDMGKEHV